jgi:hypothetical protein
LAEKEMMVYGVSIKTPSNKRSAKSVIRFVGIVVEIGGQISKYQYALVLILVITERNTCDRNIHGV